MDRADLRVFEAVARLGGMGRAAAELNTVQSNVTARVRRLEQELGAALFERHSRGVSLTAAGRRLLPYAHNARQLFEEARRAVRDDGTPRGPLVVGSLETTAALRLAPRLATFVAACPEVDLALRTGTTRELTEGVLERRLEGALVCGPVGRPELVGELVFQEELAVLAPPGAPDLERLIARGDLRIVVLRAGCSYRQRLEELLAGHGAVATRCLEFGTLEAIFGCVAAGLGITLLPRSLIGTVWQESRVAVHPLPAAEALVETLFVRRRDAFVSSALRAFLRHIRPAAAAAEAAD